MLAGNIPGRTQTASLAVYDAVQTGNVERAMLLSLLLTGVTGAALLLLTRAGGNRTRAQFEARR
jgi:molybdate transport system permease protein